jgi:predicted RNA-binding Zn-ribbon protein involved in translation (DUF1610 family)
LAQKTFKCANCGYIPRDLPVSGSWYCPKCGKRMVISQQRPRVTRKFYKKPTITHKSRDRITTSLYDKMTYDQPTDHGFKEPYLNPKINPVIPKRRDKIRLFFKE